MWLCYSKKKGDGSCFFELEKLMLNKTDCKCSLVIPKMANIIFYQEF